MVGGTRSVPVLITGCSSGIGRATAISLHAAGLTVYATARQVDSLAGLARQGIRTLALDVTDEASMTDAVAAVEQDAGPVGVLVKAQRPTRTPTRRTRPRSVPRSAGPRPGWLAGSAPRPKT
jgi:NAD(P)-dependent dehydrogenase (short-subunit alcohol dehydrogenase family)